MNVMNRLRVFRYALALGLSTGPLALAQEAHQHQMHGASGAPMMEKCQAMMADREKMTSEMRAADAKLDELIGGQPRPASRVGREEGEVYKAIPAAPVARSILKDLGTQLGGMGRGIARPQCAKRRLNGERVGGPAAGGAASEVADSSVAAAIHRLGEIALLLRAAEVRHQ